MQQERVSQIRVPALSKANITYYPDANPSRESVLARVGNTALLIRPGTNALQVPFEVEAPRRIESVFRFNREVPDVAIPTTFLFMDGCIVGPDGNTEQHPVLIRVTPWFDNVRPITVIPCDHIFSNPAYVRHLMHIHWFGLKQALIGRIYDFGFSSTQSYQLPPTFRRMVNSIIRSNIFIGTDPDTGKPRLFADADWYSTMSDPDILPGWVEFQKRRIIIRQMTLLTLSTVLLHNERIKARFLQRMSSQRQSPVQFPSESS